jgi:2-oxoglutarate dehydrogenase E2 component (dihydrolipoamide succinyltransferase)
MKSLIDYPLMNASLFGTKIHYHQNINIGLAVAIENGLIVPSIVNCEEKNFLGISRSINIMARKARENKLSIDEIEGSTFSITNFGVFGISTGTPIINQPNSGILGIGAIKKQPVVIEADGVDSIGIRNMMILSLGFDHRLIDGAGGAKFLNSVKTRLEGFNSQNFEMF